jgi:hypothetical protein
MSEEEILFRMACPPVNKEDIDKLGILHIEIPKDYIQDTCGECDIPIWVGPKQQQMLKKHPNMMKYCFKCSADMINTKQAHKCVIPLGGTGSTYITKDGKIFAPPSPKN